MLPLSISMLRLIVCLNLLPAVILFLSAGAAGGEIVSILLFFLLIYRRHRHSLHILFLLLIIRITLQARFGKIAFFFPYLTHRKQRYNRVTHTDCVIRNRPANLVCLFVSLIISVFMNLLDSLLLLLQRLIQLHEHLGILSDQFFLRSR